MAKKRDEMRGPYQNYPAILPTCRVLYANALKVLRENKMIAVHEPSVVSRGSLQALRLGHWKVRAGVISSVQLIISFNLPDCKILVPTPIAQLCSTYLFYLRDINLLVHYLLKFARRFTSGMAVDVSIEKIHMASFCHGGNAVAKLLFSPIWPWLNGELRTISRGTATTDLCRLTLTFTA